MTGREFEAYALYRVARKTFTQPWTLAEEPLSRWWIERILMYERVEHELEKHFAKK